MYVLLFNYRILRLFLLFLALNFIIDIQAQKEIEQKKRADTYFQNQQYALAISDYRQLLAQNQKNMEINFKYAACLFHTDDIKLSTRYFDLVLNQPEVPADAYYYRAKIYQHQYNFTKAIQLFTKYLELKPKKEQTFDAQTEINFCKQAKAAIGQPSSLKILARTISPGADFYTYYSFTTKKYSFYSIDDVFEKQNSKNNFKPTYAFLRGMRYRIFASYSDNTENGKDLFIQKKDEKGEWGKPVKLCAEINSTFDEDFPFLDEVEGILYFSSKGHGSIGGYDLFKVKYNLNENTCAELVNLGFPYSSPNDDYFFIPDDGTPNALFATNRNGNTAKIEIVKVEKEQKKVEMLFVKGIFSDLIDSQNTDLEISVKHKETGEVFGPIYTNKEGKYLICLPKDGIYSFQTKVTGSLTVFTKDVEITVPPKGKQFSQEIKYEMINSKEELTIISKITNEVADDEMDLLMFTQVGKLEVNAQTLQQQGISSTSDSQENKGEVNTESKENPLVEALLDKEIDIENQLKNQIVVQQLIRENETLIEEKQEEIVALRLTQSQQTSIEDKKKILEQLKSEEEELNQIVRETIILKELELSESQVVENKELLTKLTDLNKSLAEEQLKGENQKVKDLLTSNQLLVSAVTEKQIPTIEELITVKSNTVATNKATSEKELKDYQLQEQKILIEIEDLKLSKEGKSKKQIEEIDAVIYQKEKNLKTIRQVKENTQFTVDELIFKDLAFKENRDLAETINIKSGQVPNEDLQKPGSNYIAKFNNSTLTELVAENKNFTQTEAQKIAELEKAVVNPLPTSTDELAKIQAKYKTDLSKIETDLKLIEVINEKISIEESLLGNIKQLIAKETNEEQKEKINELIQLSNGRLEGLKQEKANLTQVATEVKPTPEVKPEVVDEFAKIQAKYNTDLSKIETDLKPIEVVNEKNSIEESLLRNLKLLLAKETSEDQKEKINELIQLSNGRLEGLKQEKANLTQVSTEVKPTPEVKPEIVDEIAKIQAKYNTDLSKIETDLKPIEVVNEKISIEESLLRNLKLLLAKETSEEQKEKINELIQFSNGRLEGLKQEKANLIQAATEVKPTPEVKPEVVDELAKIQAKYNTDLSKIETDLKPIELIDEKIAIEESLLRNLKQLLSKETNEEQKEKINELIQLSNGRLEGLKQEKANLIQAATEVKPTQTEPIVNRDNQEIEKENQKQIEVLSNLQSQNEERSKTLNQALKSKKEALLNTTNQAEITRLEKEVRSLESQIQTQNNQAFVNEKNSTIKKEFPTYEVLTESERKAKIASLNIEKEQLKQTLKTTNSLQDKKVLDQQIATIDSSIESLESITIKTKNEQETIVLKESEVLDNDELTKKAASQNYVNYIVKRNEITQIDNELTTLKSDLNSLKKALNQEINKDTQVEISPKQRELLTQITANEKKINEKQTLRNQKARDLAQTAEASNFEWMINNSIEATMPTKSVNVVSTTPIIETSFKIIDKQAVDVSVPLPVNIKNPRGLVYRVQVGAFRKPVPNEFFREFSPVSGDILPNGLTCYMAGYFNNVNNASTAKNEIRTIGYKDAFIVAYCDGKRISFAEAKALEASGACVPLTDNELKIAVMESLPTLNVNETNNPVVQNPQVVEKPIVDLTYNMAPGAVDAIAVESLEALFFTVQVGVYNKPIKQEQLPGFTELFTSKSAKGQIRYSSGKFQSVDDAKTRRKEAVEKGVADAFIVAYYQGKRITIVEANQLITRFGASVFEEKPKVESSQTETNVANSTGSASGEPIVILQKKVVEEKFVKFEQTVDEENVRTILEQLNQNGIFTYNPETGKISSNHLKESQLNTVFVSAVTDMIEVIVAKGKIKPLTFALNSSNWSGSFGNWILHCPYEFNVLNNKEIQFFPRTNDETEELKRIAKELLITIYE
ncbi:MAG: hypothetical protein FGM14_03275 [Flavobacteriales bacterium]|nr:hypothetical protein [Flavobacteriales bacterium]